MNDNTIQIYHNPRCSKSRATLKLVEEHIATVKELMGTPTLHIVHYLDTPPDRATLTRLVELLDCSVHDILRNGDSLYRELGLGPDTPEERLLDTLEANPALLQRPIVVFGDKAIIGRPPENVQTIL